MTLLGQLGVPGIMPAMADGAICNAVVSSGIFPVTNKYEFKLSTLITRISNHLLYLNATFIESFKMNAEENGFYRKFILIIIMLYFVRSDILTINDWNNN